MAAEEGRVSDWAPEGWSLEAQPEDLRKTLTAMSSFEWDEYCYKHGQDNIVAWLRHSPCHLAPEKQLEFAAVLAAYLVYECPLPRLPTPRQRKRDNAKQKQQQDGEEGAMRVELQPDTRT